MASARKKQDEKNLKTLRDIVALPGNKHCFDCNQRGPTYVNMTIGSFVCTRCSGLLRGLTPPHRVKSISMASFSQDEIDFVRIRGNELCRNTWLALYDTNNPDSTSCKDEQQILYFMEDKYEKKKYYHEMVLRNGAIKNGSFGNIVNAANGVRLATPPSRMSPMNSGSVKSSPSNGSVNGNTSTKSDEFVADFGSADIFNSSTQTKSNNNNVSNSTAPTTQPSFANFDNNVIFNSSNMTSPPVNGFNEFSNGCPTPKTLPPPSEDRYAALKDLDNALKNQQEHQQQQTQQTQLEWGSNGSGYASPMYGSPVQGSMFGSPPQGNFFQDQPPTSNPFSTNNGFSGNSTNGTRNPWSINGNSTTANNFNTSTTTFSSSPNANNAGMNPFRDTFSTSKFNGTNGFNGFQQQSMFQSSHFNKPWVNVNANPFTLGVSPGAGGNSSNPFL